MWQITQIQIIKPFDFMVAHNTLRIIKSHALGKILKLSLTRLSSLWTFSTKVHLTLAKYFNRNDTNISIGPSTNWIVAFFFIDEKNSFTAASMRNTYMYNEQETIVQVYLTKHVGRPTRNHTYIHYIYIGCNQCPVCPLTITKSTAIFS